MKVGDRVSTPDLGEGIIVQLDSSDDSLVVKHDREIHSFDEAAGYQSDRCDLWYYDEEDLIIIEEADQELGMGDLAKLYS